MITCEESLCRLHADLRWQLLDICYRFCGAGLLGEKHFIMMFTRIERKKQLDEAELLARPPVLPVRLQLVLLSCLTPRKTDNTYLRTRNTSTHEITL